MLKNKLVEITDEKNMALEKTKQDLQKVKSINKNLTENLDLANQTILEIKAINNAVEDENDKLISEVKQLKDEITILSFKQERLSKDYQSKVEMFENNLEAKENDMTQAKQEFHMTSTAHQESSDENVKVKSKDCHLKAKIIDGKKQTLPDKKIAEKKTKNIKCSICNATYAHSPSLNRHIKMVHEEKKKEFKCSICNATFGRKDFLTSHIAAVHEHKKPFKCAVCNVSFSTKAIMKIHHGRRHIASDVKKN